jgi:uncharacterized membrane protein
MVTKQGKNIAIISYFTILGAIIALFMNADEKSSFASFHIRQGLGLALSFLFLSYIIGYFDSWMISGSFYLSYIMLLIFGLSGALQSEQRTIPLVGSFFQSFFKNL